MNQKNEKEKNDKQVENADFLSQFDSLGGYTGNNYQEGYEPEQDADDM